MYNTELKHDTLYAANCRLNDVITTNNRASHRNRKEIMIYDIAKLLHVRSFMVVNDSIASWVSSPPGNDLIRN